MDRAAFWENEKIILQYEKLWQINDAPQLRDFTDSLPEHPSPALMAELCRVDAEHRIRRGMECEVEHYLMSFPAAFANTDSISEFQNFVDQQAPAGSHADCTFAESGRRTTCKDEPFKTTINLPPETSVDQFTIIRPVGRGAFSHVYEAIDTTLGRKVALKFLSIISRGNDPIRQRMLREAHTVALLDHPGIVPVYGIGDWNGFDYIASRLVNGQTLDEALNQDSLSPRQSVEIIREIAMSLEHAHQLGIVHRDIKPANIMIESGRPLLLDFGLAHFEAAQSRLTVEGEVIGTPAYMAPEQAEGRSYMADGRSDLYSLGVLLYRMICGHLPFDGPAASILSKVIHHDPVPLRKRVPAIDRDLETIVMKCLEKEPSARYQKAALLADDLQRHLDGAPIRARRVGTLVRLARWTRRRPIVAAALFSAGIILAALAGALSQLQTVRRERDRAVLAETEANRARAESRSLLSETAARAGQLAMQRGRWQTALEHFDQALQEDGEQQQLQVAWDRLSALVSLRRIDDACEVLADIIGSDRIPENDPLRLYWQAELAMETDPEGGDCEEYFEKSIEAGLTGANHHYARGMLATHTEQAAAEFRLALSKDSFHHRARRELVLLLVTLARLDEANEEAIIAGQMFPEDPDFGLFQALILALQGDLPGAIQLLQRQRPQVSDIKQWESVLQLIQQLPDNLQVFPDDSQFDPLQLNQVSRRLREEVIPLFAARGWFFPPRIASRFNDLPELLSAFSQVGNRPANGEAGSQLAMRLKQLSSIHPEATLLMLRSYIDFLILDIDGQDLGNLSQAQIDGLERMRDGYRRCLDRRFLLNYSRDDVWRAIYLSSMLLAVYANHDTERNRRDFIEAARQLEPSRVTRTSHLRACVITLLNAGAVGEAERWAKEWVQVTGGQDFDAYWHLMITAQQQEDWLTLEKLGREGRKRFPESKPLEEFHLLAISKLREIVDSTEPGESGEDRTAKSGANDH